MYWLKNSIICWSLAETEKPRIDVSLSLFARDCMYPIRYTYLPYLTLILHTIGIKPTLIMTSMQPIIGYTRSYYCIFIQNSSDNYVNNYALQHSSLETRPESTQSLIDPVLAIQPPQRPLAPLTLPAGKIYH